MIVWPTAAYNTPHVNRRKKTIITEFGKRKNHFKVFSTENEKLDDPVATHSRRYRHHGRRSGLPTRTQPSTWKKMEEIQSQFAFGTASELVRRQSERRKKGWKLACVLQRITNKKPKLLRKLIVAAYRHCSPAAKSLVMTRLRGLVTSV